MLGELIPPDQIRVGMRAQVATAADENCAHDIIWGVGEVTFTELEGRTEVAFDGGNGGMFPHYCIRRELIAGVSVAEADGETD